MALYNVFQVFDLAQFKNDQCFVSGSIILDGIGTKTYKVFKLSATEFVFLWNDEAQFILTSYGTWVKKGDIVCRKSNDFIVEIGFAE
jgi:hypothetical protein